MYLRTLAINAIGMEDQDDDTTPLTQNVTFLHKQSEPSSITAHLLSTPLSFVSTSNLLPPTTAISISCTLSARAPNVTAQ